MHKMRKINLLLHILDANNMVFILQHWVIICSENTMENKISRLLSTSLN